MDAVVGTLLLAVSALAFFVAHIFYRRPGAGAWTRADLPANAIVIVLVIGLAAGVGLIGRFAATFPSHGMGLVEAAAVTAIVAAWVAAHRALRAYRRRLLTTASGAVVLPMPTPTGGPAPSPAPPPSRRGARRARTARRRAA